MPKNFTPYTGSLSDKEGLIFDAFGNALAVVYGPLDSRDATAAELVRRWNAYPGIAELVRFIRSDDLSILLDMVTDVPCRGKHDPDNCPYCLGRRVKARVSELERMMDNARHFERPG